MKEYEVRLSGFCDPFWKAAMALKRALEANEPAESLLEEYSRRKARLEQFLDCQRTSSGIIGAKSTIPEWVGPIRGSIATINTDLSKLQMAQKHCPELSAELQLDSALG